MGLVDQLAHPDLMTELTLYEDVGYPLTCTVYQCTKTTNAAQQEVRAFTTVLASHVDLRCRKTPLVEERPTANEYRMQGEFEKQVADYQCSLAGYYPLITTEMQLQCDGTRYEIVGVEQDANHLHTRLRLLSMSPLNA
jgi:hypothetical protein